MNTANDTLMRQWKMLRLIPRAPHKTSVQELQRKLAIEDFPVNSRTIQRDLLSLSEQFPLVSDESAKPYGWSWARDSNFDFMPRLSPSQGVALLLARAHLRNFLPQLLLDELSPIFDQAEKEVASGGWKDWHKRTAILQTSLPLLAPKLSPQVLDHVHEALARKCCLRGRYRSRDRVEKEMVIHPLGLLVRGSVQYLVCTLRDYKDIKHLALHRLGHTEVLADMRCSPPKDFDFGQYVASMASKYQAQGRIWLVARFTADAAAHLRDTPVSRDQVLTELPETGQVELTATVENDKTLRWWLLAFGSLVEVMAPKSLRREMRDELANAVGRYD